MAKYNAIVVTFDDAIDDDTIDKIKGVMALFVGVIKIEPMVESNMNHVIAKNQVRQEMLKKIYNVITKE